MKNYTQNRLNRFLKFTFALSMIVGWTLESNAQTYCEPSYPNGSSGWRISEVGINDFTHSPSSSQHDYTSEIISFEPGDELEVAVTTTGWTSFGMAVDWNKDGDFDDTDEVLVIAEYIANDPANYTLTVTMPSTVTPDTYRLRLWNIGGNSGGGNPADSPCGVYQYGSWVDYTLAYYVDCSGTPDAGSVTDIEVCPLNDFTLTTTDHSPSATGQTVQWQSSEDGNTWSDITDATDFDYTVNGGVDIEMYYRMIVSCTINEEADTSGVINVTILPGLECYCEVTSTSTTYGIGNFTTTNGIENINNSTSGGSYSDYTDQVVSQVSGEDVNISISSASSSAGMAIWIDWNDNGSFSDAGEKVYNAGSYSTTGTGTITVPLSAAPGAHRMRVVANYLSMNPTPCGDLGSINYGEAEDYTFEVIALEECAGQPEAGTVEDFEICSLVNFTLSTTGPTTYASGLNLIWQSSPAGDNDWSDIAGSEMQYSYNVQGGIEEAMDYRFIISCDISGLADTSEVIQVTIAPAMECYCEVTSTSTSYGIGNFTTTDGIENINNSSSGGSYSDYTDQVVSQVAGESIDFSISSASSSAGMAIWIDWNNNGSFNEPGEKVYNAGTYVTTGTGTITVPLTAAPGEHRMRVVANYLSTNPTPCGDLGNVNYGEAEDYTFTVIALEDCDGQPDAGTVEDFEICAAVDFTLTTSGATTFASGINLVWQSSPAGDDDWSDVTGSEMQYTFNVQGGINEAMDYRFIISCDISELADTSDVIQVTLTPAMECYCEVTSTNTTYGVGNFTTTDGIENINNSSGSSGYSDYTDQVVSQLPGESVDFSISTVTGSGGMGVWIDWNDNGSFNEPDEQIYNSGTYLTTGTGTITVPIDAAPGAHRMRVVANYLSMSPTPCGDLGNIGYGEAEDYTFNVIAPEGCLVPISITKSNIENHSITISWSDIGLGDPWTSYNYELRTEGEPGSGSVGLISSGNLYEDQTVDFTNLENGIEYTFYAQTNCDENSSSDWTAGYTFELPTYIPVPVTGFDADVVANGLGTASSSTTNDIDGANYALVAGDFQVEETDDFPSKHVPDDRQVKNNEKWFELADYAENNSLRLESGQEGTLEFIEPRAAEEVYILGLSGSGTSTVSGTINFSDNTTQSFSELTYPDWYAASPNIVLSDVGRVNMNDNSTASGSSPNLYENIVIIDEENLEKTITGVTISHGASTSGYMNVMAISIASSEPVCIIHEFDLGDNLEICEGDELILTIGEDNDNEELAIEWQDGSNGLTYDVTESGTYTVTVTYEEVCEFSDTIEVVVNPLPLADGITSNSADGFFFDFTAEGVANAETYNWDFGDGITSQQENPSHYYADEGEYTVTLTIINDCGSVTVETTINVGDLGVSKNELDQLVKLYPNPSAHEVTIEVSNHSIMEEITVINSVGQTVYQFNPKASVAQIDVSAMAVGIYTVVIQTETAHTTKKLNVLH